MSGLTDSELAGQSELVLKNAVAAGHIEKDRAAAMLDNETIAAQLSEDKKKVLREYTGRVPSPVNVPPSTNTPPPPKTPPAAAPPPPPKTPPAAPPPIVNTPGPM